MTIKTLLTGLMFISICIAQNINISGIVTDTSGMPVVGANVILEGFGLNDTTGMNGEFLITDVITGNQIKQSLSYTHVVEIFNGFLFVNVQKELLIEVVVYTPQGRIVSEIRKTINAGTRSIALPRVGVGIYFYQIKIGNNKFVLKNNSISRALTSTAVSANSSIATASCTSTDEVIKIVKDGYFDHQVTITSTNINDMNIQLTICPNMVVDIDGNAYYTVKIGTQTWMMKNLRATRYNDGSPIPMITNDTVWSTLATPAYCYYNNTTNSDSIEKYGALYNQYVVNSENPKKIAPTGWHVPTSAEWDTLNNYLITNGFNWDGTTEGNKAAKSLAANTDWMEPDTGLGAIGTDLSKNNRSMFTALPAGYRGFPSGKFQRIGYNCCLWSSTKGPNSPLSHSYVQRLDYDCVRIIRGISENRSGYSVRLLQNSRLP